jgi:tetratricopeptide (TPR) repeat protein
MMQRCLSRLAVRRAAAVSLASLACSSNSSLITNSAVLCATLRCNASTAAPTPASNPVNVETFELDEAIVKRHQEIAQRWSDIGEELQLAKSESNHLGVIAAVAKGHALLEEVGPMESPVQCYTNLCMEEAQAHFNLGQGKEALEAATKSKESLKQTATAADAAMLSEIDEFIGHALLLNGEPAKAEEIFRAILLWIDTDARKALPMVSVAAVNQRRTVLLGIGMAIKCAAEKTVETRGDGTAQFAKALDLLLDALALNTEAQDAGSVKQNLLGIIKCFVGVGDSRQAVATCEKYINFCHRAEDPAGVEHGNRLLQEICDKFNIPNPMIGAPKAKQPDSPPADAPSSQ